MAHGFEYPVHILLAIYRDDHDRARRLGHDPPSCLDAIHHRHDQVHENQIRHLLGAAAHRLGAIAGHPDHLVRGFEGQRAAQRLHRHGHVVDDGDLHP
ncbi:hypothetical protein D3C71_1953590 [compost metagenome]